MITIREATQQDENGIRLVHLSAFAEDERELITTVACQLLAEETTPPTISLVVEAEGTILAHVALSPVTLVQDESFQGYILAPLAVLPEWQNRKIGSKLVEAAIERLRERSAEILFVYGDPQYYGRFGFDANCAVGYIAPYELTYPFGWQAVRLNDRASELPKGALSCVASLCKQSLW